MDPWGLAGAVALGALAAAFGTPTGVSGGLLLLPVLLTGYGLVPSVASATTLLFNVVSTPVPVLRQRRTLPGPLVRPLLIGAAPAAVAGALLNVFVLADTPVFRVLVAALLVAVALAILPVRRGPARRSRRPAVAVLVAIGAAGGLLGGFYGLGGAVLAAPAIVWYTRWPVTRVAGAALVTTLVVSVTGLATYAVLDAAAVTTVQTPDWTLGLALGVGGIIGGYGAARIPALVGDRTLRLALALLVTAGAVRLVTA